MEEVVFVFMSATSARRNPNFHRIFEFRQVAAISSVIGNAAAVSPANKRQSDEIAILFITCFALSW